MSNNLKIPTLGLLFRKFAARKLDIKEMKQRLKPKQSRAFIDELEKDVHELQQLKNKYSFGKSEDAQVLADQFASKLRELEAKINHKRNSGSSLSA